MLCSNRPHRTVIEIGAGDGAVLKRLSEMGFGDELYALEISRSGVEAIGRQQIPRLVESGLYDGERVPYDTDRFDLAVLSHVVEHADHPRQLIREAARVARLLFVEVPLEDTLRLRRDYVEDGVGHINTYSPKTIRRLVQTCGLRVLAQITTNAAKETYTYDRRSRGLLHYYIKQTLLSVAPRLATGLFCYHGALVCEKLAPAPEA
jgi:SAM-dependent methyltransferase